MAAKSPAPTSRRGTLPGIRRVRALRDAHPIKFLIPIDQYRWLERQSIASGESKAYWVRMALRNFISLNIPVIVVVALILFTSCASTTLYYPGGYSKDGTNFTARKAIQLYGDSLGNTMIEATPNGIRYAAAGGNDNSSTTRLFTSEFGRTSRWLIGWGFSYGILNSLFGHANSAFGTYQAAHPANVAAKPAPLPSVGSTIPAQTSATLVPAP